MRGGKSGFKLTNSECAFFGAALLVFIFLVVISWPLIGARVLCWIKNNSELATWVQAVGSIGAIIGSAYLARYQFVQMEMTKRNAAGDLLVEFYIFFKHFDDGLNSLEQNINNGQVSAQEIIRLKKFTDEFVSMLRSIKLEDLSSEWAMSCVYARCHVAILQSLFSSIESILINHFDRIPLFSPSANINTSEPDVDGNRMLIYQEVVFMHFNAKTISESIIKLGGIIFENKDVQSRFDRSNGLYEHFSKIYKHEA